VALCRRFGFERILLLVRHAHEAIRGHFGDGARHGIAIDYRIEPAPRGTAGALCDALHEMSPTFVVLYGDTYVDVDLRRMLDAHRTRGADATLFVHPNDHPYDSDLVELDPGRFVKALHPKPHWADEHRPNLVNGALYVMERSAVESVPARSGTWDIARDLFPDMLRHGRRLYGYVSPEYIKDIGTPERLDRVTSEIVAGVPEQLSGRQLRSAVFLDRDGTLNREVDYLRTPAQLALLDGVGAAIRRLNVTGRLAVVITNQSVVARGEVTLEGLRSIQARMDHLLVEGGAYVDAAYTCPHHPDRGFPGEVAALKVECDCRKPRTGLLDAACRDLMIDRRVSWLVGDTTSDVETGRRAGVKTILVRTGHAGNDGKFPFRPDYVVPDLPAAVSWILEGHAVVCRRMAPVAAAAVGARLVVIGGHARSGKSSAAQVLKEATAALGRTAHVLSLDSWLKPADERAEGAGVMSRFDIAALVATLQPIIHRADWYTVELPVYDRAARRMYERRLRTSIGPDDLIIVEGVPALLVEELAPRADVRVYMEMPEPHRVAQLRADYRWRGVADEAVDALLASRASDEWTWVQEGRARADFTVAAWTAA
jgi:histidinol-phosphate phosphatase family protein